MKINNLVLSFLISISVLSCQNIRKGYFTEFPVLCNVQGKITRLEIPFMFGTIFIVDSLMILTNTPDKTKYIHLFNRSNFKYISSSGMIGRGPGEISNPFYAVSDSNRNITWCLDQGRRKILCFPIDSILNNENFIPNYSVPEPVGKYLIIRYEPFNNELFSFYNDDPAILISFFDHYGNIIDTLNIKDQLELYQEIDFITSPNIVTYIYSFHPSKEKIAIAARFSDKLAIIDRKGNILNTIQGPDLIDQIPAHGKPGLIVTNFDIDSDDRFIYCLYDGQEKSKDVNGMITLTFPMSLHVFDWNGKPVSQIRFEYSVSSFAIDRQYNRIVTFSPDIGDIVCYELPDLAK